MWESKKEMTMGKSMAQSPNNQASTETPELAYYKIYKYVYNKHCIHTKSITHKNETGQILKRQYKRDYKCLYI